MRRALDSLWRSGIIQACIAQVFLWLHRFGHWYVRNARQTVPATVSGLFAYWLAHLFAQVPMTAALLDFAGIPHLLYYAIIVGIGALLGAGIIEFRSPYDGRHR